MNVTQSLQYNLMPGLTKIDRLLLPGQNHIKWYAHDYPHNSSAYLFYEKSFTLYHEGLRTL